MTESKQQQCVHCLGYHKKLTEDHVFPESWYPAATPPDIEKWTVPACTECNRRLSVAEEKLFNRLAISVDPSELAAAGIGQKFVQKISKRTSNPRSIGWQVGLLMGIVKSFVSELYSPGKYPVTVGFTPKEGVRSRRMIRISGELTHTVCIKIIRGLEYKLRSQLIGTDRRISIIWPHENNQKELDLVKQWEKLILPIEQNTHRGPGFVVRYGVNQFDTRWVIYNVKVWNQFDFWAMISPVDSGFTGPTDNQSTATAYANESIEFIKNNAYYHALESIDKALELNSNDSYNHSIKAHILRCIGEYKDALESINKAENLNPNNYKILLQKTMVLGLMGKYDDALKVIGNALTIKIDDGGLWYYKGLNLLYLKKYEEALPAFNRSLQLSPHVSIVIEKKISCLIGLGKYQEAVELFESSDLEREDYNWLLNNIGFSLIQLSRYKEAEKYLRKAKLINGYEKSVYYNLYQLNLKIKKYHYFLFYLLVFAYINYIYRWIASTKKYLKSKFKKNNIGFPVLANVTQFIGAGRLFSSSPQSREALAILKLIRGPNMWALCNDTVYWTAINIPLDIIGKGRYSGDIDIIVCMPREFLNDAAGFIYRSFEVKASLVHKGGLVKSLKSGKHKAAVKQLNKLRDFGAQQVFLLDIYIAERGYSAANSATLPREVIDEINRKAELLKQKNFGYVMLIEEPAPNINDELGGIAHMLVNILPTQEETMREPFTTLVKHIDSFYKSISTKKPIGGLPLITYCKQCKELILLTVHGSDFSCPYCSRPIY